MMAEPLQKTPADTSDPIKLGKPPPWLENIKHFTPSWFAVCTGTGVVTTLLHLFPYPGGHVGREAFKIAASTLLLLNAIMFITFTIASMLRYMLFRRLWNQMLQHPTESLFLGCFPMAFSALINGTSILLAARDEDGGGGFGIGGDRLLWALWIMWWIDVALAVLSNFGMFYIMVSRQKHALQSLSGAWLLPIVPTIVASSTGCILAQALLPISPPMAFLTYQAAVILVSCGLSMALMIMTVYAVRLITDGFPTGGLTISVLAPLGPLGQGGYTFLLLSEASPKLFSPTFTQSQATSILYDPGVAPALRAMCFGLSVMLWVMGFWILVPSTVVLARKIRGVPFAVPWWGMAWPSGIYAVLTIKLSQALASPLFKVLGAISAAAVIALWLGLTAQTVMALLFRRERQSLFHAPCLDEVGVEHKVVPRQVTCKLLLPGGTSSGTKGDSRGYGRYRLDARSDLEKSLQEGESIWSATPDTRNSSTCNLWLKGVGEDGLASRTPMTTETKYLTGH